MCGFKVGLELRSGLLPTVVNLTLWVVICHQSFNFPRKELALLRSTVKLAVLKFELLLIRMSSKQWIYDKRAPQTDVSKYDWLSLWKITPYHAGNSQQLIRVEKTLHDPLSDENKYSRVPIIRIVQLSGSITCITTLFSGIFRIFSADSLKEVEKNASFLFKKFKNLIQAF